MRILVVEDDPHLRKLTAFALGLDAGLVVELCASGEEALDHVRKEKPDLVLLDLEMPGMGGAEAAKRLAPIPVVIMTGKQNPDLGGLPIRGVIRKPFDPTTLAEDVRRFA
jgi:CheY-like chemotaxis protein